MSLRSCAAAGAALALGAALAACGGNTGRTPQPSAPVTSQAGVTLATVSPSPTPVLSPTRTPTSPATTSPGTVSPTPSETFPIDASMAAEYPDVVKKIPDAVQVVRDLYAGVNHEIDTGDESEALKTFGPSGCLACANQVVQIKDMLVNGNTIRGGHFHILSVDLTFPADGSSVSVQITDSQDAGEVLDVKGNVIKEIPAIPPTQLDFEVGTDEKPYLIQQIVRLSP